MRGLPRDRSRRCVPLLAHASKHTVSHTAALPRAGAASEQTARPLARGAHAGAP